MPENRHQSTGLLEGPSSPASTEWQETTPAKLTTWGVFILEPNLQFSDTCIIFFIVATLWYTYRQTSFYCASPLLRFEDYCISYKCKVCGNAASGKSIGTVFNSICLLRVCHILIICNISNFFLLAFLMVICDQWCLAFFNNKVFLN